MITLNEIQSQIDEINKNASENASYLTKPGKNRIAKRLIFLRRAKWYVETVPNEDCLELQLGRIKKLISEIPSNYIKWKNNTPRWRDLSNPEGAYNSEVGLKELKSQKEMLSYLLKI